MMNTVWSHLLAKYEVADEAKAMAYEAASPAERACLKNGIAFHSLQGEGPNCEHIKQNHLYKGYALDLYKRPAEWACYICAPHYVSPARLIAALMPALLAQVPHIYVLHLGERPDPALLVAFELLGIEQIVAIPEIEKPIHMAQMLLKELLKTQGRVLFLNANAFDFKPLCNLLKKQHVFMWEDAEPPHIYAHNLLENENILLNFAQPDAIFHDNTSNYLDAIYGYTKHLHLEALPRQMWAKGMEGCFIHSQLNKEFFQNISLQATGLITNGQ